MSPLSPLWLLFYDFYWKMIIIKEIWIKNRVYHHKSNEFLFWLTEYFKHKGSNQNCINNGQFLFWLRKSIAWRNCVCTSPSTTLPKKIFKKENLRLWTLRTTLMHWRSRWESEIEKLRMLWYCWKWWWKIFFKNHRSKNNKQIQSMDWEFCFVTFSMMYIGQNLSKYIHSFNLQRHFPPR